MAWTFFTLVVIRPPLENRRVNGALPAFCHVEVKAMFTRACLVALVCTFPVLAAGTADSGPQVGEMVPGPFQPLNVNGPNAGQKACLYCRFGTNPVVMIFAREASPQLVSLLKRVDAATAAHGDDSVGSCAIFCNDAEGLPEQLDQLAKQTNLNHIVLATFAADGPSRYKIAPDADVTVLLYTHGTVKANHSFKTGELTEASIETIMADLPLILTQAPQ
jgi:hypothetical protein